MCEYDTETRHLQRHVQIRHIDDQLNKRKISKPLLEIETQGNVNRGCSSHPPVEGNKSVPEGWIISDINKLQDHHTNKSNSILEAKI